MTKESDTENAKKRRKSINSNSSNASTITNKENDMYKMTITFEEEEALKRSPEKDSEIFLSTCDSIREAMSEIAKLKTSNDPKAKDEIHELQIKTALAFVELKKLNRMEKFRTKFARDSLTIAKSGVDSRHLQLQNLLYEVMHLKKEVIKCLQFKSKDELIELVPIEEFYKEAPESISQPNITKNDAHKLRLARLEWELTQRKQLASLCDELTENKKSVAQNIESKQQRLDNLGPQLRIILEASKPLQNSLGLPIDKVHKEYQKASLLPSSLYVLYAKAIAYRDAYDNSLIVTVEGDEDDAKRLNNNEGIQDSDSDQEIQSENVPDEIPVHKKRHHRLSKEAREEEKKLRILQKHPLSVMIIININSDTKMTLSFYYLTCLKIITVESRLDIGELNNASTEDMLNSESILRELYPKDTGTESPNPANSYQLMRFNAIPFSSLGLGTPYKWTQRMAGLNFISDINIENNVTHHQLSKNSVDSILKEIKRRVKARLDLCNEIRQLESGNLPVSSNGTDLSPTKISTNLHKFSIISWRSYSNYPDTQKISKHFVLPTDIFYEAVLRRGTNDLIAHIAIKPDYPKVPAVITVNISSSITSSLDIVRDIEREVNVMWDRPPILSNQLHRLRTCFDIYLETENMAPREKIFFHPVKGRIRERPYKYLALGGGIFTQR
ncbi:THO complex subunit 5 homolog [Chelonus insularis]|uniref:THO complex subunit 5 homolog n=1 Tax=Chelonus insularis TaxID=460826 RepID=UPI00158C3C4C|nr:THO complex subunit 5 homolog [Chelonus insularis]XP_034938503.1 THO complex subunit 5 homolog [Chelonus insularis]XP_034938504.1 THO complex subunit 5 homolog [Chelonus insularis]